MKTLFLLIWTNTRFEQIDSNEYRRICNDTPKAASPHRERDAVCIYPQAQQCNFIDYLNIPTCWQDRSGSNVSSCSVFFTSKRSAGTHRHTHTSGLYIFEFTRNREKQNNALVYPVIKQVEHSLKLRVHRCSKVLSVLSAPENRRQQLSMWSRTHWRPHC